MQNYQSGLVASDTTQPGNSFVPILQLLRLTWGFASLVSIN